MPIGKKGFSLLILLVAAPLALACMWDYDTLIQERARFPSTLEIITGKFLRHSREFYQWRIQDRLKKLEKEPGNFAWLDDLAVAYDKIGQNAKAIETILIKNKFQANLYETESNLAVFLFHAGKLEESIQRLDLAIKINPDAHFGREVYQKYLTEYVLGKILAGKGKLALPMAPVASLRSTGFFNFLNERKKPKGLLYDLDERQKAIKGVLGMMRFAKHDAPVLLEALGNLLADDPFSELAGSDGKLLAARAYLKASYEAPDEDSKEKYRQLAEGILSNQTPAPGVSVALHLRALEKDFQAELQDAAAWYQQLKEKELSWIQKGINPEQEFDKLYDQDIKIELPGLADPVQTNRQVKWLAFATTVLAIVLVYFVSKVFAKVKPNPG